MLPPHKGMTILCVCAKKSVRSVSTPSFYTYFFPLNSGQRPARTAAMPVAPAPSITAFSISMHRRILMATHSSETVTILSIKGAAL